MTLILILLGSPLLHGSSVAEIVILRPSRRRPVQSVRTTMLFADSSTVTLGTSPRVQLNSGYEVSAGNQDKKLLDIWSTVIVNYNSRWERDLFEAD